MKNKQHIRSKEQRTKRKSLNYLAAQGKKEVIWSLHPEEAIKLAKSYRIVPYLYSLKTRKFPNIRYIKHPLLKELHFQYKRGKSFLTKQLNEEELNLIKDHGISCRIVKYRITLN